MDFKKLAALLPLLYASSLWAIEPFVIKDIRVEGIQRTEPGTIFSYLPVKVGDTLDDDRATASIHALFATGFFKDVKLQAEQTTLVVVVKERPTVASVEINGVTDFPKQQLIENLKNVGLAEGRIFDKSALEKSEHELKRQYLARGKYAVQVATTVTELERNRAAISFNVKEGGSAKIQRINIVGNKAYDEDDLLDVMQLTTPGVFTWMSKNDQYSKPKLSADIESLRSFYMNSGYMDFNIESTQVSISPDKKNIFITLNISEGEKYTISSIKVAGPQAALSHAEIRKLITVKEGDTFSRSALTESNTKIGERLGEDGYAFANINAIPEVNKEKRQVAFTFLVDPMQRAYVRRINIAGNDKTRDEVLRREFRQMEGGWFSTSKIRKSKQRLDRTGFFSETNLETSQVTGTNDQLDVNVKVTEKSTGNFQIGMGYSDVEKLTLMGGVTQSNLFGTGNSLSAQVNTSKMNQVYSLSYTNPYYTPDGISRGFDIYKKRMDGTTTSISPYKSDTAGAGVRFGVPINDEETFQYGLSTERTTLFLTTASPQRYIDYVGTFGDTTTNVMGTIGWTRDTRNSAVFSTDGTIQRSYLEVGLPVSASQRYYRWTYQQEWYYPVTDKLTLMFNGDLGYANGYDGRLLPFFKYFHGGGVGSVRGYDTYSLGPRDISNNSIGGNKRVVGNAELLFPVPGMEKERSVRLGVFVDGGAIYGSKGDLPGTLGMRYSAGTGLTWFSPVGPMRLSWAWPLNAQPQDKLQKFQFTLGTIF